MKRVSLAIGTAALLLAVVVGTPWLLAILAGWPLPTRMPDWSNVSRAVQQGDVGAVVVINTLAVIGWVTWFQVAWATFWETLVNIPSVGRGRRVRAAPGVAAPLGRLVTAAFAIMLASTSSTSSSGPAVVSLAEWSDTSSSATFVADDQPRQLVTSATVSGGSAEATALQKMWVAVSGESLWDVAEIALGDGGAVDEIVALNPDLSPTASLRTGRKVVVPASAEVPADRLDGAGGGAGAPSRSPATEPAPAEQERPATYTVTAGDSVYGIAERFAGPDPAAVAEFADRVVELNQGRWMTDHRRFDDPAAIDVGWVLELPDLSGVLNSSTSAAEPDAPADHHVVRQGESLWSIADDELGDPTRWPEIYDANNGRAFDDGRTLSDPDLIHPGWNLDLPGSPSEQPAAAEPDEPGDATMAWGERVDDSHASADADAQPTERAPDAQPTDASYSTSNDERPTATSATPADQRSEARDARRAEPSARDGDAVAAAPDGGTSATPEPMPADAEEAGSERDAGPEIFTLGRAAMLSAGVLALLAVRRRNQLRRLQPRQRLAAPSPETVGIERELRSIDPGERFLRVDIAVRASALALIDHDQRVLAATVAPDGEVTLVATGPVTLSAPWTGDGDTWVLPASTPVEMLSEDARRVAAPAAALVQIGRDAADADVYVDLEAIDALEIGGSTEVAESIVRAIAMTLAGSVLAEVTTLVHVGVDERSFLGHRHHLDAASWTEAGRLAVEAVGSTANADRSTFELRARATSGETWEPAIVLAGSSVDGVQPVDESGVAVVSAAPITGPSSRLAPEGDGWVLRPVGLRFTPIGLSDADVAAVASLVGSADLDAALDSADGEGSVPPAPPLPPVVDPDATADPYDRGIDPIEFGVVDDGGQHDGAAAPSVEEAGDGGECSVSAEVEPVTMPPILVRMVGPVSVESRAGEAVEFERSKTRELVAWLSTHRERSTRTAARTALWDLDVRDATFANVVSEARRSLARLVAPPDGEEWVARTMTEALPLHEAVRTDADLIEQALDVARVQPPSQAIDTLTPVVDLIVGIPFEGTSYLWPDAEGLTSHLIVLATGAAAELAAHCLSVGDIDGVFNATHRGLQVLPGHEELISLRMRAFATSGDHAGIRGEWESYERVITADPWSDGEPSPKLVELRQELLS